MVQNIIIEIKNETETAEIAQKIAKIIHDKSLSNFKIYLSGDLGAGKTTFAKYFLKALGVTDMVKSPTYTIIESYVTNEYEVEHIDLYRIQEEDLYDLGFLENDDKIWVIEWPEKGGDSLPKPDLLLSLSRDAYLKIALLPESDSGKQLMTLLNL